MSSKKEKKAAKERRRRHPGLNECKMQEGDPGYTGRPKTKLCIRKPGPRAPRDLSKNIYKNGHWERVAAAASAAHQDPTPVLPHSEVAKVPSVAFQASTNPNDEYDTDGFWAKMRADEEQAKIDAQKQDSKIAKSPASAFAAATLVTSSTIPVVQASKPPPRSQVAAVATKPAFAPVQGFEALPMGQEYLPKAFPALCSSALDVDAEYVKAVVQEEIFNGLGAPESIKIRNKICHAIVKAKRDGDVKSSEVKFLETQFSKLLGTNPATGNACLFDFLLCSRELHQDLKFQYADFIGPLTKPSSKDIVEGETVWVARLDDRLKTYRLRVLAFAPLVICGNIKLGKKEPRGMTHADRTTVGMALEDINPKSKEFAKFVMQYGRKFLCPKEGPTFDDNHILDQSLFSSLKELCVNAKGRYTTIYSQEKLRLMHANGTQWNRDAHGEWLNAFCLEQSLVYDRFLRGHSRRAFGSDFDDEKHHLTDTEREEGFSINDGKRYFES